MKVQVRIAKKEPQPLIIKTEFIRLDSALKLSSLVATGGEAKFVIQDGLVKVNGEVCLQRGKKLRQGDIFEYERKLFEVVPCM